MAVGKNDVRLSSTTYFQLADEQDRSFHSRWEGNGKVLDGHCIERNESVARAQIKLNRFHPIKPPSPISIHSFRMLPIQPQPYSLPGLEALRRRSDSLLLHRPCLLHNPPQTPPLTARPFASLNVPSTARHTQISIPRPNEHQTDQKAPTRRGKRETHPSSLIIHANDRARRLGMILLGALVVLPRVVLARGAALLVVRGAVALARFGPGRMHVQLVCAVGDVVFAAAAFPGEEAWGGA